MSVALRASQLAYRYSGQSRDAVANITLELPAGSLLAVVGPNGSGKSTLLRLLTGTLEPQRGSVRLEDTELAEWTTRALARHMAVVTQREVPAFALTVRDLVTAGRYAHVGPFRAESDHDRQVVMSAFEACDIPDFASRDVATLSGGEFQRARIARALAQEPRVLVLDEPTASLDVHYQVAIFELLQRLRHDQGLTVVVVTHRLELAARFADELLLLDAGRCVSQGSPAEVIDEGVLSQVYQWPLAVRHVDLDGERLPLIVPRRSAPERPHG